MDLDQDLMYENADSQRGDYSLVDDNEESSISKDQTDYDEASGFEEYSQQNLLNIGVSEHPEVQGMSAPIDILFRNGGEFGLYEQNAGHTKFGNNMNFADIPKDYMDRIVNDGWEIAINNSLPGHHYRKLRHRDFILRQTGFIESQPAVVSSSLAIDHRVPSIATQPRSGGLTTELQKIEGSSLKD